MKKIICICMIATLCIGVSGCSKNQTISADNSNIEIEDITIVSEETQISQIRKIDEIDVKMKLDVYRSKQERFEYDYIINDFEHNVTEEYEHVNGYEELKAIYEHVKQPNQRLKDMEESLQLYEASLEETRHLKEESFGDWIKQTDDWIKQIDESKAEESSFLEQSKEEYHQELHDFTFILNVDSGVYHLHECSAAKRMKDENKRYVTKTAATQYEARQQVEADGYRVCGICIR